MAIKTAGTKTTSSLSALQYNPQAAQADIANIAQRIKNDMINGNPIFPGAFEQGCLFIPNRGVLKLQPLDWVMVDGAGFPLVIPNSIFSTSWQHS